MIYSDPSDFYALEGTGVMKLTPKAALEVCLLAAKHDVVIARIEGGIWHNPGFEARSDCIWDGADPPISTHAAEANNLEAAEFVRQESGVHNVFILTAPPLSGWPHNAAP